jgi:hypothetical protein
MIIRLLLMGALLSSCSTLKKSMMSSALIGGVVGGLGGSIFSPSKKDQDKNAFLFAGIGSATAAAVAYLAHERPIHQKQLKHMMMDESNKVQKELPLFDFSPELKSLKPNVDIKPVSKYQVPLKELPDELKGKVKKQFIIEYQSEAKTIKIGNKTFEIGPFKAWEHVYEE